MPSETFALEPAPPCFARGTRVLTPLGYVSVENLKPGDPVVTAAGDVRAVRWVGRRSIDIAAHRRPEAVRPVRILPSAIADGVPARTVTLSPDHALLLRGLLVPVKLLVNGALILRDTACQAVTYLHVELDRHDILLAENLAVESYLDTGNRAMFESASGAPHRVPVFGRGRQWNQFAYADLCLSGPVLRDIRQGFLARVQKMGFFPRPLTDVALWADGQKCLRSRGSVTRPVFTLPQPARRIAIRSPSFVPAEFMANDEDDYRHLGIAIREIRLGRQNFLPHELAVSGFHPRGQHDQADWTDGNGIIAVPNGARRIRLDIAAMPRGWRRIISI
jgi:hypothetical protein